MKAIIGYIKAWFCETDKRVLAGISALTGLLIWINYSYGFDNYIGNQDSFLYSFLSRGLIFLAAFSLPHMFYMLAKRKNYFPHSSFSFLLVLAPLIFSFKIAINPSFGISGDWTTSNFWNHIFYWPVLLIIIAMILFIIWKIFDRDQPYYGTKTKDIDWTPYLVMLFIMVPLVAAASTQPDFKAIYPKLKLVTDVSTIDKLSWWQKLLFELSYGSDFITIELFFRGFLVLAFIKWAGKDAILPMACFYCTIHFGNPLGAWISSYFSGTILCIVW